MEAVVRVAVFRRELEGVGVNGDHQLAIHLVEGGRRQASIGVSIAGLVARGIIPAGPGPRAAGGRQGGHFLRRLAIHQVVRQRRDRPHLVDVGGRIAGSVGIFDRRARAVGEQGICQAAVLVVGEGRDVPVPVGGGVNQPVIIGGTVISRLGGH